MKLVSLNPATEKIEKKIEGHSLQECLKELEKTAAAQKEWKKTDYPKRAKLMKKAARVLRSRKQEFAQLMAIEMGKPITQAIAEVEKCAWVCEYYAQNAEKFLQKEPVKTEAKKSFVQFEPLGVVFAIMPWNFPFWQVFRFAAPALMAGNAGALKHASNVPQCALAIEKVFLEAGFPQNIFKALLADSKTALELIGSKHVSAVSVTGSTTAGSQVAQRAGKFVKKCVLELGGSDPFIVLDGTEIKETAKAAALARTINSGQSCIAAKRFIVHKKILRAFEKEFAKQMSELIVGDPLDTKTQVGPLAKKELVETILVQLNGSVKMGAKILCGGKKIAGKGFFFEPTVLGNVSEKMPAFLEETFGPLAAIIVAKDDADAARLANKSEFGLGASIWCNDEVRAEKLAPLIEAGMVFVNKTLVSDPRLPFGGIKMSGFGRELGLFGIREFVNVKTVVTK